MSDLFRIATDRVTLQWSRRRADPPLVSGIEPPPGRLNVVALRADLQHIEVEHRDGIAPPKLFEETDYSVLVIGRSGAARLLHDDPLIAAELNASPDGHAQYGVINFRSQVGLSLFRIEIDGAPELQFEIEVFPTKVDYRIDYADLIDDTEDFLAGLALEYLESTFHLAALRPKKTQSHTEWLAILSRLFDRLERALHEIARQPTRALRPEHERIRASRLRKPDASVRRALARDQNRDFVHARRPRTTLDTAEHRWLASQLRRIRRRLAALRAAETTRADSARRRVTVDRLRALEGRVDRLLQLEPMRAAEGDAPPAFASMQLLKAPGYAAAYRVCLALTMGLQLDADALRLSIKDIFLLYEYWCFLTTVRLIAQATGSRLPLRDLVAVEQHGLRVTLKKGKTQVVAFNGSGGRSIKLTYAPRFRGAHTLGAQEPDFTVEIEEKGWPVARLVVDAKYRVVMDHDARDAAADASPLPAPPADAMNVIYRYQTAIVNEVPAPPNGRPVQRGVLEGAVLFPYREREPGEMKSSRYVESLTRTGTGALPLLPRGDRYYDDWLRSVLQRDGWQLADRAVPEAMREALWTWRATAAEIVLVAVLRSGREQEHLDWIRTTRRFYTPDREQARLLHTKFIAFYAPAKLYGRGMVRHWAEVDVERTEIVPLRAIDSPLPPRGDRDEPQVLFHLRELHDSLAIENRRHERFVQDRWSTRLALFRAKTLEELLLETEPEWRLHAKLRTADVDFDVTSSRAPQSLDLDAEVRGRASFHVGDRIIRHVRGSRFQLQTAGGAAREVTLDELLALW